MGKAILKRTLKVYLKHKQKKQNFLGNQKISPNGTLTIMITIISITLETHLAEKFFMIGLNMKISKIFWLKNSKKVFDFL